MGPRNGHLLSNIAAAGYQPDQIDEVYITHMHGDHIGGLTSAGSPTFRNAIVRASKDEADYWLSAGNLNAASADAKGGFQLAQDSLAPYIKSGRFKVFTDNATLQPGIRALGTHGHTPGHTSYFIESNSVRLLVLGDIVHVAAVQFPKPSVTVHFDVDADAAAMQREKVFRDAALSGYWVAGEHIAFPGIGHIRADGGGYIWIPANYSSIQ
jgi:glyoxylase-like metal-dependent hydrolase (beta-lactamase superfamily II)